VRAAGKTARLAARSVSAAAFWNGDGYIYDPIHGGVRQHVATVEKVVAETSALGFALVECVGSTYPSKSIHFAEPWYYYVFRKPSPRAS
jgi:hypothetical protein